MTAATSERIVANETAEDELAVSAGACVDVTCGRGWTGTAASTTGAAGAAAEVWTAVSNAALLDAEVTANARPGGASESGAALRDVGKFTTNVCLARLRAHYDTPCAPPPTPLTSGCEQSGPSPCE